jgi:hypothetical protein
MAHRIEKRDKQQGRQMAWHDLTEIVTNLDLDNNWLRTGWDIEEVPLTTPDGVEVPFKILVGSDDKEVIGKPFAGTYKPISNNNFLNMIKEATAGIKGMAVESVGSVCNRGRVFVSISLKDSSSYKIGHRQFNEYLNFGNGHDQSSVLWVNNTNICTVCNNTFSYNLTNKNSQVNARVFHRGDVELKLTNIAEIIDAHIGSQAFFKAEFERLMSESMSVDNARNVFAGWSVRNDSEKELTTRGLNKVNRITELFVKGAGNTGSNRADAFSAVTDYYTHESTRGGGLNKGNQFVSSEFGLGRAAKDSFWDVIRDGAKVDYFANIGKNALSVVN